MKPPLQEFPCRTHAAALLAESAALLVDLDGTLLDSTAAVRRACAELAHRHGLDEDTVYYSIYGRPPRQAIPPLLPDGDDQAEIEAFDRAELEYAHRPGAATPLPGAADLLSITKPLAIVTSCAQPLAAARLRAAGLVTPRVMITADDVNRGKPDPEGFLRAAQRLEVSPTRCVVVEDSPAGITAGHAAGARVIALRTTREAAALREADAIVDDLAALLGIT